MKQQKVKIVNKLGLHARAAAKLVSHAARFASEIELVKGDHKVNGKSIMGVMMLAASKGTEIELHVSGEDEIDALDDIIQLINNRFGEEE